MLIGRIGANDEKVVGCGDAAVAGTGGKDGDVTGTNGNVSPAFATENEIGVAGGKAEDLVRCGMVMVERIDAVAPLRRPAVGCKEPFHYVGKAGRDDDGVSIEKNGQGIVGHPAIWLKMKLLRCDGGC